MSILIEVVFETVPKENVIPLLARLINDPKNINKIECSENVFFNSNDTTVDFLNLIPLLDFDTDICLSFSIELLQVDNLKLPSVLLRTFKYGCQFDIDFNFDIQDIKAAEKATLLNELFCVFSKIAKEFEIGNYFAGFEPAADIETRFFTNGKLEPLVFYEFR